MWRRVTHENLQQVHTAFLCGGLLLGLDMTVRGVRYINCVPAQKYWGVAIVVAVLITAVGQLWLHRGNRGNRWLTGFIGHTLLFALYAGLAAEAFLSFEPTPNGQLAFAVLYSLMAVVHRMFIHGKSDVPE